MGTTTAGEREVVERFAELDRLLGVAASAVRPDGLSAHAAEQIQNELISITKRASGLHTLLADRAAEGSGWRARQARTAADDLARRAGTSTAKAKDTLDTSKKAKRHPSIEAALQKGTLSAEQASEITGAAEANPAAAPRLVADAQNMSLQELRDRCARVKAAADRDPAATAARLHRDRFLRYGRRADGSFSGSFKLAPEAGAELDAVLRPFVEAAARQAKQDRRGDTIDQISADALVAMARAAAAGPGRKTSTQVNVIVDRDALLRGHSEGEEVCEYSTCFGAMPVPVSVVQEILDDAFLVALFHDGTDVRSVVRTGRHIPLAIRDALRVRDDFTCSVPGCHRRARLEFDHTLPYARGGPTRYANLGLLCWHHHQEKTADDRARDGPRTG